VGILALGAVALAATLRCVPSVVGRGSGNFANQARAALAPRVMAMLGVGFLLLAGQFTAFTYLAPFLTDATGVSSGLVSAFLLAFGITSAVGTFLGGRAADRSASVTLIIANILLIVALAGVYLARETPGLVAVALAAWGLVGFGLVPAFQLRVISLAGPGGDLAATLGASAANAGIATGASIGGAVVAGSGVDAAVLVAVGLCALALPATWAAGYLRGPGEVRARRQGRAVAVPGDRVPEPSGGGAG
jgi:MFS transporter, DHA1 family, inner membrane transport protein